MQDVFINKITKFLPNYPVSNDEMESYLGKIDGKPSKAKRLVLRSNKIKTRYYALNKQGIATHTNSQLVAESIKLLFKKPSDIKDIEMLTAGTSSPDQFMPSHAVMVHGELPEMNSIEVMTASGNCCSGIQGLKYAFLNIATGQINNAVCAGSERLSRNMRAEQFEPEIEAKKTLENNEYIAFEKDFLRWMLSDGAASALLSNKKNEDSLSFKIDWIEGISYANKVETCMYMAATKNEKGELVSFKEHTPDQIQEDSILSIKQDVKLLSENILKFGMDKLQQVLEKHKIDISRFDYFLHHLSSYFFEEKIYKLLKENNLEIPKEKWFTNLAKVGNVGAASPLLMLEEIMHNGQLKKGDKLLIMVPESARFSYIYMSLTVC
jgi:3-oxoacyl-[acyl-carrier-protein] synthase-3